MSVNEKTDKQYWDNSWSRVPRMRLPSGLFVGTRNIQRLLKQYVKPGMRILEIGCAPGKILAWVAKNQNADVSGIDYSPRGIETSKMLFEHLGIPGDLRCEDIFETKFEAELFDCVYSNGVIEHFNDPKQLVEIHVRLLKSGGKAIIVVPNYRGVYGRLQRYFDPDNLALHNLDIMDPASMAALTPVDPVEKVRCYPYGRMNGTLVNLSKKLPSWMAKGLILYLNVVGHLQPFDIKSLCPLLVLEITKK